MRIPSFDDPDYPDRSPEEIRAALERQEKDRQKFNAALLVKSFEIKPDDRVGMKFRYLSKYGPAVVTGTVKEVTKDPTGMSFVYYIKSTNGVTYSSDEIELIPKLDVSPKD